MSFIYYCGYIKRCANRAKSKANSIPKMVHLKKSLGALPAKTKTEVHLKAFLLPQKNTTRTTTQPTIP